MQAGAAPEGTAPLPRTDAAGPQSIILARARLAAADRRARRRREHAAGVTERGVDLRREEQHPRGDGEGDQQDEQHVLGGVLPGVVPPEPLKESLHYFLPGHEAMGKVQDGTSASSQAKGTGHPLQPPRKRGSLLQVAR